MFWKNLHIYVEKKSKSKYSQYFLSLVAFIESIFFPIPPDIILIPIPNNKKLVQKMTPENVKFKHILGPKMSPQMGYLGGQEAQAQEAGAILKALVFKMAPRWLKMASSSPR